jgi:hypothetical protein
MLTVNAPNPFAAKWSAQGHTMCLGHWQITYQGLPLTIPKPQFENDMGTYGNFSYFYPDEDEYIEGKRFEDWLEDNIDWLLTLFELHNIPSDAAFFEWFYQAVNKEDWRCSSCGGCT